MELLSADSKQPLTRSDPFQVTCKHPLLVEQRLSMRHERLYGFRLPLQRWTTRSRRESFWPSGVDFAYA
jgi:hypothetical protein